MRARLPIALDALVVAPPPLLHALGVPGIARRILQLLGEPALQSLEVARDLPKLRPRRGLEETGMDERVAAFAGSIRTR